MRPARTRIVAVREVVSFFGCVRAATALVAGTRSRATSAAVVFVPAARTASTAFLGSALTDTRRRLGR